MCRKLGRERGGGTYSHEGEGDGGGRRSMYKHEGVGNWGGRGVRKHEEV